MIVIPILLRELRARGHSPAQWWGRAAVALLGGVVSVPQLVWTTAGSRPDAVGRGAFIALVSAAFLVCCGACLLTADAISRERREGTLGLLLLTRASCGDILTGKFASTSFSCFTGLLALTPLLAMPLLVGGTTFWEAFRHSLALLNTLVLALALGLCISAFALDRVRTSFTALFLMATVVLVPLLSKSNPRFLSPLTTLKLSADAAFFSAPVHFWLSLGVIQVFAWVLLCIAGIAMGTRAGEPDYTARKARELAEQGAPAPVASGMSAAPQGCVHCWYCGRTNLAESTRCRECGTELYPKPVRAPRWTLAEAPSPLHWLFGRQQGSAVMLWVAAALAACQIAVYGAGTRLIGPAMGSWLFGVYAGMGFIIMGIVGGLIACVASRHVIEARRNGSLELLLTTPLGAQEFVATQWHMLKRIIRLPLLVMLVPSLLQTLGMLFLARDPWAGGYALQVMLSMADLVLSVGALCWLALWFAFQGMSQGRTIFWTVLIAYGLPYAWRLAWGALISVTSPALPLVAAVLVPQMATLLFYIVVIRYARGCLRQYPGDQTADLRQVFSWAVTAITRGVRRARAWPGG